MKIDNINHYGDIMAIPFFAIAILYLYSIDYRNPIENILLFFCISGFILDIFFTFVFLKSRRR
uniref:Uncharacterized protein n=1 Tax=viral metagenome TaxID=1070528 RepID=A0A6C0DWB0_9ZZZZ